MEVGIEVLRERRHRGASSTPGGRRDHRHRLTYLAVSGALTASADFAITGVTVAPTNPNNAFTGTMTINTGGTFLVGATKRARRRPHGPATVGLHLAGGTLSADASAFNATYAINRLTGNGTLETGQWQSRRVLRRPARDSEPVHRQHHRQPGLREVGAGTLTLGGRDRLRSMTYIAQGEVVVAHSQALANTGINVLRWAPPSPTTFPSTRTAAQRGPGNGMARCGFAAAP